MHSGIVAVRGPLFELLKTPSSLSACAHYTATWKLEARPLGIHAFRVEKAPEIVVHLLAECYQADRRRGDWDFKESVGESVFLMFVQTCNDILELLSSFFYLLLSLVSCPSKHNQQFSPGEVLCERKLWCYLVEGLLPLLRHRAYWTCSGRQGNYTTLLRPSPRGCLSDIQVVCITVMSRSQRGGLASIPRTVTTSIMTPRNNKLSSLIDSACVTPTWGLVSGTSRILCALVNGSTSYSRGPVWTDFAKRCEVEGEKGGVSSGGGEGIVDSIWLEGERRPASTSATSRSAVSTRKTRTCSLRQSDSASQNAHEYPPPHPSSNPVACEDVDEAGVEELAEHLV
ncbi:hypothetical protein BDQ17DRAFT_1332212 [Cyathus striatus]|nr:hypothetical protein BDQ17DRAFT_1332212 [Cyathus striatus]